MQAFAQSFTTISIRYKNSILRFDVRGSGTDVFAYLCKRISEIDQQDNIPEEFSCWRRGGKHYFYPLGVEELGSVLQQELKHAYERSGLAPVHHPKIKRRAFAFTGFWSSFRSFLQ